jgi:hypothetical protein
MSSYKLFALMPPVAAVGAGSCKRFAVTPPVAALGAGSL